MSDLINRLNQSGLLRRNEGAALRTENVSFHEVNFSMYGQFTPITVRSSSITKDAYMERDRSGNSKQRA